VLAKIKAIGFYVLAGIVLVCWLIFSSRRAGKKSQELKQKAETLNRVQEANEVEHDISRLSPDERRERLRKHK
jgi:hypothetical protein|tara:strand:- start:17151 stop:17369 length:219 start_codon:yes stop_codon:yes gene_type:complete